MNLVGVITSLVVLFTSASIVVLIVVDDGFVVKHTKCVMGHAGAL